MKVLVLGGDGYLGWPTALHFSARGHDVTVVDNFLRRRLHMERGSDSLTPIRSLQVRVAAWEERTGNLIRTEVGDLCNYPFVARVLAETLPDVIVHYAEIPSAPYSMAGVENAVFTHANNVVGTLNLLFAMRDIAPDAHLIKLGTMGEYGTPNIDIEEGFLDIVHNGRKDTLPFPKQPGSFYHLTKVHDSHNIMFACRIWGLRSTDLNQGVVYGIHTDETQADERLITRFDYDEAFGTALNRFCVQAIVGYPLTVYGSGGQTRGFLNIRDTLQCVNLAADNPPSRGEYRVFNQFTEQFSVGQLAELVRDAAGQMGIEVDIQHLPNPRIEREEHYYNARHTKLLDLGLRPHRLGDELIRSVMGMVQRYESRIDRATIAPSIRWAGQPEPSAESR